MDELEKLLGKTTIVDARGSGDEIIPGALFIAADANDDAIATKLPNKKAEIVIYCGSIKCPASMTLATRLVALGYTNVKHYAGGIAEWVKNNKSTTKTSK
jgi:rhodanese-related sulfurtransferase